MVSLDLYTVRFMTVITVVMSSIAIFFAWNTNRAVRGMPLFALGFYSLSFGAVLGLSGIQNQIVLLAGLGSIFRFAGIVMVGQSIRRFRGFRLWHPGALVALTVTTLTLYFYWLFGQDSEALRIGFLALGISIVAADASASMFRAVPKSDRITHWPTGLTFGFVAFYMAIRGIANITGAGRLHSVSTASVEVYAAIGADIAFIALAFGMLLASNARLRHAAEMSALFDPLTGLPNRRLFYDRIMDAEERARTTGHAIGFIYLDLDDFKLINDTYGHQAGDELLKAVTAATVKMLRAGDCLARVGGDEFVILAQDIKDRAHLLRLAERVSAAIEHSSGTTPTGTKTAASWGAALFPEDGSSAHDVMREADMQMYRTKRSRRKASQNPTPHASN